jgi:hypothetical protein
MSETTPEAPATDPPGDKIYVCPACGIRYDEPTTCSEGHPPTETVEYDRVMLEAAVAGDAEAQAAIDAQAAEQAGTDAGAAGGEMTVAEPSDAAPPQAAPPADDPAGDTPSEGTPPGGMTDAPPVEPDPEPETPADPGSATPVGDALAAAADAIAQAGSSVQAAITAASGS